MSNPTARFIQAPSHHHHDAAAHSHDHDHAHDHSHQHSHSAPAQREMTAAEREHGHAHEAMDHPGHSPALSLLFPVDYAQMRNKMQSLITASILQASSLRGICPTILVETGRSAASPLGLEGDSHSLSTTAFRRNSHLTSCDGRPVGSGKTALTLALCKRFRESHNIAVVTNDIFTKEDQEFLIRNEALSDAGRIRAIETGHLVVPMSSTSTDAGIQQVDVLTQPFEKTSARILERSRSCKLRTDVIYSSSSREETISLPTTRENWLITLVLPFARSRVLLIATCDDRLSTL